MPTKVDFLCRLISPNPFQPFELRVKWRDSRRTREQKMLFSAIILYFFRLRKVVITIFFFAAIALELFSQRLGTVCPVRLKKIWWAAFNPLEGCLPQNQRVLGAGKQSEIVFFSSSSLLFIFSFFFVLAIVVGFEWLLHKSQVKAFFLIQIVAFFFSFGICPK